MKDAAQTNSRPQPGGLGVWIAQGMGVGRIPVAPGTFGSVVGVLWFFLLLMPRNLWVFAGGSAAVLALSIWLCGVAERALGQTDPGSVVLDEIAAMPVCFASWVGLVTWHTGSVPSMTYFVSGRQGWLVLGIYVLFRFFDIAKPWPVRQSQALPGGWGITVDDFLAALYVNAVVLALYGVGAVRP